MTHDEALAHFLDVFGVTAEAKTQLRAAFTTFVRATKSKGTLVVDFDFAKVTCAPPARVKKGLPKSFSRLLSRHATVRIETQTAGSSWSALHVVCGVVERDEDWLVGTSMQKVKQPITLAAYVDQHSDLYCYDPTRKTGSEPALVFLSHEGGRGTVSKVPIAAVVAQRLMKACRASTAASPGRITLPPISDGGLVVSTKALSSLRSLLEQFDDTARTTVTRLHCTSPLTTTDGIELLPNLEYARLERLRLKDLRGVEGLTKLRTLNAKHNALTRIPRVPSLVKLELTGNSLTSMAGLESLKQLEVLELGDNPVERIEGLELAPKLKDALLPQGAARITAKSLERLVTLSRDSSWALALEIDGKVPARLAKSVDRAQFRRRVCESRQAGVDGLRALAKEALRRGGSELTAMAEHSHGHSPTAEQIVPWSEFLELAVKRNSALLEHFDDFRAAVLRELANDADWGMGHEHALRETFLRRFIPTPLKSARVAIALGMLHASRKEREPMLAAVARAIELGSPRRHIELRDDFKPFLRSPELKALLAKAKS